jgi:glycosyltransferase involved in cell wall biosynthesis
MDNQISALDLSVIVLTFNEECNISKCLDSLIGWTKAIYIVDSFSTDKTLEIARVYTDKIWQHAFENYSKQFNWALEQLPIHTEWIMRLDADETVTPDLKEELIVKLHSIHSAVTGLYVKRRVYFLNRWIRHGGMYPRWHLKIWRKGKGYCERTWMDEHIKLIAGRTHHLNNDIIDNNAKDLNWWTEKHNAYATREALNLLALMNKGAGRDEICEKAHGTQEQRKRWYKKNVYCRLPLLIRPLLYFIYRYLIRFGFLDGKEGMIFHFLQGYWYRFLADAKIYERNKYRNL